MGCHVVPYESDGFVRDRSRIRIHIYNAF